MSGKFVKLCRSLNGIEQESRQRHRNLIRGVRRFGFGQGDADAGVKRVVVARAVPS